MHRLLKTVLSALVLLSPTVVLADNLKDGSVRIVCKDDVEEKIPDAGNEWTLIQIGAIDSTQEKNEISGEKVVSVIDGLEFKEDLTIKDVLSFFDIEKKTESYQVVKGLKSGDSYVSYVGKTNKDGELVFEDLDYGVYLGINTKASEYHLYTDPFIVSVPTTVNGESSTEAVVNPKPQLAGHIDIKVTVGGIGDVNKLWTINLNLPDGKYACFLDGKEMICQNGQAVSMKHNQILSIKDIPHKGATMIGEREENTDGYITNYINRSNEIIAKQTVYSEVKNHKYPVDPVDKVSTGLTGTNLLLLSGVLMMSSGLAIISVKKLKED